MKKLLHKYAEFLAALAIMVTTVAVNSTCTWLTYQPELPKNAGKLRKFKCSLGCHVKSHDI